MLWIIIGFALVLVLETIHGTLTDYEFKTDRRKKSRRRR